MAGLDRENVFLSLRLPLWFSTLPSFGDPPAADRGVTPPHPPTVIHRVFFVCKEETTWSIWSRLERGGRGGGIPLSS